MRLILSKTYIVKISLVVALMILVAIPVVNFIVPAPNVAQAAINLQINYQGKLTNTSNVAVADGDYNMEFKLYDAISGGSTLWTETRTGANKVTITNGLFSVMLGSVTSLSSVDFNQSVYLGVNIGGTGSPAWDGEMSPRKTIGSVPASFLSNGVNGDGGVRNTLSSTTALAIAKAGTNYALQVDTSTASAATGLKVTSAAASSGLALSVISSGTNENLTLDAKGTGTITLGGTSSGNLILGGGFGDILLAGGSGSTGCTVTNSTGAFACTAGGTFTSLGLSGAITGATGITSSGTINFSGLTASSAVYTDISKNLTSTPPTSGTLGYWSRTNPTIQPATTNDIVSIPTANTTGADLALTNTGVYTGTGIFNLTANSATTGNLVSLTANGLTTGSLLSISSNDTAATTGQKGINVSLTGALTGAQTTYGGYFSNTRTGASAVNVGAYFTASGATGANYAAIFNGGSVGIGTTTPNNLSGSFFGGAQIDPLWVSANDAAKVTAVVVQGNLGEAIQFVDQAGTAEGDFGVYTTDLYFVNRQASGGIRFANVTSTAMFIDPSSNIGIGNGITTPTSLLSVGSSYQFQVNSTGKIVAVVGIANTGAITNTINSLTTTNGITNSATGLTSGYLESSTLGSALTTGGAYNVSGASYNHGTSETGSILNLAFTDATTGAFVSTTNGALISPTINITSGATTKTINAVSINPTFTACTISTCNVQGLNVANVTDSGNFTSSAIKLGTGWDTLISGTTAGGNLIDFTNFKVTSAGVVSALTGLSSSGTINFSGLTASSEVYTDSSKNLTSTPPTSGTLGYWSRATTVLQPSNTGDSITTTGNISTTSTGTITSAGLLTGSAGITATTGNVAITAGALTLGGTTRISNTGVGTLITGTVIGSQTFTTNNIADSGALTIATGANGALTLNPNGTGSLVNTLDSVGNISDAQFNRSGTLTSADSTADVLFNRTVVTNTTGSLNDTANFIQLTSNITGTGTDTGSILGITQSHATATGDAVVIANSGTGKDISGTSNTWNISKAGAAVFVGVNSGAGLLQGQLGLTVTGAAVSLNASSNFNVDIATGTSTGTITLGGTGAQSIQIGSGVGVKTITIGNSTDDTFSLFSSALNISTAGVISGATGLTSSGTINFSGLSASSAVYTDGSKNLTSTAPTSGAIGYWSRTGTTLSQATTNDILSLSGNSGDIVTIASSATGSANKALNVSQTGATTGTDYAGYFSNTGAATTNVGLYATATGATNNYAAIFDQGNVGIGTTTPAEKLEVAGSIKLNSGGSTDTVYANNTNGLALESQGNTYGTVRLTLQNIGGSNGALFEQVGGSNPDLVDFGFKGSSGVQRNIRVEYRGGSVFAGSNEFQLGIAGDPTFVTSDSNSAFRKGNLGIGDTSPAALLTVGSGDLFQVNSSGAIAAATGITSSGTINFSGLTASTGVYTDGSKNLTSTAPTSGTLGYWSRSGTTISPATSADTLSVPGAGTSSEKFGAGSSAAGNYGVAVGNQASATAGYGVALGYTTTAINGAVAIGGNANTTGADSSVAIGYASAASNSGYVAVGRSSTASGASSIAIGYSAIASSTNSIAISGYSGGNSGADSVLIGIAGTISANNSIGIGTYVQVSQANSFVAGSDPAFAGPATQINNVYFGKGITSATPTAYTINGTGGSGTNIAGGALQIAGGIATGNAAGGNIIFQTSDALGSGATAQSLTTKAYITAAGDLYTTTDGKGLYVGGGTGYFIKPSGGALQIGSSGSGITFSPAGQSDFRGVLRFSSDFSAGLQFDASGTDWGTLAQGAGVGLTLNNASSKFFIKGYSSQTANLQEWQNSSGTPLASVSSTGALFSNTLTSGGTQCLQATSAGVITGSGSACGGGGLTVGTTAIASGTAGRVLFEGSGNVLQEAGGLTWDNTDASLVLASASTTASNKALSVSQTGATSGTDYAGYFSNTGAATTNIALYANATGGTNNYAAIFENGNVGIGTITPTAALTLQRSGSDSSYVSNTYSSTNWQGNYIVGNRAEGTSGSPSNVAAGDHIVGVTANAYANSGFNFAGSFTFYVEGTPSGSNVPTYFTLWTASSTGAGERLHVKSTGEIGVGTSGPDRQFEINSATGSNLRLTYNDSDGSAANYADLLMSASGDLTIAPSGGDTAITGNLGVTSSNTTQTTTGSALALNTNSLTTGTGLYVSASSLTSGSAVHLSGSGAAMLTGGKLLQMQLGSNTVGSAIAINSTGAYTGVGSTDGLINIVADSLTTGYGSQYSFAGLTTGTGLRISGGSSMATNGKLIDLNMGAATAGNGLNITTTGVYTGKGLIVLTANSATTGTLASITGDGLTTGSLLSLASASTAATTGQTGLSVALTGALTGAQTTYGGNISNTHTGASAVNIGLYATASGATGANYAAIFAAGNVGIGTATPTSLLSVGASSEFQVNSSGAIAAATGYIQGSGTMSITSANTTQTTTSSAFALNVNSLTTGTGLNVQSSTLTSGSLINLAVTGTAGLTNQKGINVSLSGANGTGAQTTYGGYFSNTHTGTSNNVGLYSTASGGTNNYAAIFAAGNVGIGTTTPVAPLSVFSAVTATANYGTLSVGNGVWDGVSAGKFVGAAAGTLIAANAPSGSTADLLHIRTNGNLGGLQVNYFGMTTIYDSGGSARFILDTSSNFLTMNNGGIVRWGSVGTTSVDVGIARASAGLLEVDDGNTLGAYRDIKFRTGTATTSVVSPLFTNAGALSLTTTASNGSISITPNGTGAVVLTSGVTTGTTTTSALALSANSLTTGTGLYAASSTLTSGKLIDLQVSGTAAAASQTALNILTTGANGTAGITTYGAQISNTHSTNTSTNVGLLLSATGGATANYALITNGGNVGIGTTTPGALLTISGGTSSDALRIGDAAAGYYYKIGRNTTTGYLDFDGTQSGYRGYTFNDSGNSTFNNADTFAINSNGSANMRVTISAAGASSLAGLVLNNSTQAYSWYLDNRGSGGADHFGIANNAGTEMFAISTGGNISLSGGATSATTTLDLGGTGTANAVCHTTQTGTNDEGLVDCTSAPAADFAEMYPVTPDAEEGDVVAIGTEFVDTYETTGNVINWDKKKGQVSKLVKSTSSYAQNVVGVVSDNYGDFISTGYNIKPQDNPKSIALVGRVLVKVSTENGDIKAGDFLTSSATLPGYAMKATTAGPVIGMALADFNSSTPGKVMVFVKATTYNGVKIEQQLPGLTFDYSNPEQTATNSAQILASLLQKLPTLDSNNLSEITADVVIANGEIVTPSVTSHTVRADLLTSATANGGLSVASSTIFNGGLTVDSIGSISGLISIQSDVEFFGTPYFTVDTAGFAVIKAGVQTVDIKFSREYLAQPIVNASFSFEQDADLSQITDPQTLAAMQAAQVAAAQSFLGEGVTFAITNKSKYGFTIVLNKPAGEDVKFSWTAFAVRNATTFMSLDAPQSAPVDSGTVAGDVTPPNPDPTPVDPTPPVTPLVDSTPTP